MGIVKIFIVIGWSFGIILMVPVQSISQIEQFHEAWRWAHFTTKTGLPSDIVEDVVETDDGTVWASTLKGLAWYDGFRWHRIDSSHGLPAKQLSHITKGRKNEILAIINTKLYTGKKNDTVNVSFDQIMTSQKVHSVTPRDSVSLIIHTHSETTFVYQDQYRFYSLGNRQRLYSIWRTRTGTIWGCTDSGIGVLDSGEWTQRLGEIKANLLVENKNGQGVVSVLSPNKNVGVWEWEKNSDIRRVQSESGFQTRSLDISSDGDVIAAYESGELRVRHNGLWRFLTNVPRQISDILFVKFRHNNDVWIGTERGLFLFQYDSTRWEKWKYPFGDARNIVMEIYKTSFGDLWIGTNNGIVVTTSRGDKRHITQIHNRQLGLITGINEDKDGCVWICSGSSFDGAFRWDGVNWKHYGDKDGLYAQRIHKIRSDRNGNLYFLGLGSNFSNDITFPGVFIYNRSGFTQMKIQGFLDNNRVYSFAESKSGALWFGTKGGVSRSKNGQWKHWGKSNDISYVYTIAVDKNDNIWFSNYNSNLGYISSDDSIHWVIGEFIGYRQQIWDLQVDKDGVIWIAGTRGLFSYYNDDWTSYSVDNAASLRELRVIFLDSNKIYTGGHGSGIGSLHRNSTVTPLKIEIKPPKFDIDQVIFEWNVYSYWGRIKPEDIETRYRLDNKTWSQWSKETYATTANLSSGTHILSVQAKDHYGLIRDNIAVFSFKVPYPLFLQTKYVTPLALLFLIIVFLIWHQSKNSLRFTAKLYEQKTRIANDLHDEVGSNLGSIALLTQRIEKNIPQSETVKTDLAIINQTALQTAEFLRDIVWYINPRYDEAGNLEMRLRESAEKILHDVDIKFRVSDIADIEAYFIDYRRNIYLMYKEILHNIQRHSNATKVDITVARNPNYLIIDIRDNGIGFDTQTLYNGNGLLSIKKRAKEIGAELTIISTPGVGTNTRIVVGKVGTVRWNWKSLIRALKQSVIK